MLAHVRLG